MRRAAWMVLALAFVARPALAADPELEALLDESVIQTASKTPEVASAAPATSTLITAEALREHGIQSLDQALNFLSLGMAVESPVHNLQVGARGVMFDRDYGDHVLLLLDGHVMNEAWDGSAYFERGTGIPIEIVDHLEVVLGPGSVLYGSNAVLGVVNVVTKRAKDWPGVHAAVESELPISVRAMGGAAGRFKLGGKEGEALFAAEYYAQKGPTYTFALQHASDDFVTNMPRRFSFDPGAPAGFWGGSADRSNWSVVPSGYARVAWGAFEVDARASLFTRSSPFGSGEFNSANNYETDRWVSGDVRHHAVLSPEMELRSRLYADSYDYLQHLPSPAAQDCRDGQTGGCVYVLVGYSRWVGLEEQLSIDWLKDGRVTTLIGADARVAQVGSEGDYVDAVTAANPGPVDPYELGIKTLGVYGQQAVRPLPWLSLNAGARLDVYEGAGSRLSPRLAAAVSPWRGATLKIVYAEAFRAPNSYEKYNADPTYQLASPDLKPETARTIEASIEQKAGTQRALFGVFRSWFNDLVADDQLSPSEIAAAIDRGLLVPGTTYALQYKNLATVDDVGFEAALDGSLLGRKLRYGATITAAIARSKDRPDDPPQELTVSPQVFGNARLAYDLGEGLPTLAMVGRLAGKRAADQAFEGTYTPRPYAPPMAELRWTISGRVPKVSSLSYRASLSYASSAESPYVVGPGSVDTTVAALGPIDRVRASLGLGWDFEP